jgi:hypothetical protein
LRQGYQLADTGVVDDKAGAVSGRVLDLRIDPERLSGPFIQGNNAAFRSTGHAHQLVAFDNYILGQGPDAVLCIEFGFEVHYPNGFARFGFVCS